MRFLNSLVWCLGFTLCPQCGKHNTRIAKFCARCAWNFSRSTRSRNLVYLKWSRAVIEFYREVMAIEIDPQIFDRTIIPRPVLFDCPIYDDASFTTQELLDRAFPGRYEIEKGKIKLEDFPRPEHPTLSLVYNVGKLDDEYRTQSPHTWRSSGRSFMTLRERIIAEAVHLQLAKDTIETKYSETGGRSFSYTVTLCPDNPLRPYDGSCIGVGVPEPKHIRLLPIGMIEKDYQRGPRRVARVF